jgi:hypothetical protein
MVVFVALACTPILIARQGDPGLFAAATPPVGVTLTSQFTTRSRWVTIDPARLEPFRSVGAVRSDAPRLQLNLFPDQQFAVAIERVESTLSGRVIRGRVTTDNDSTVALAIVDGVIAGKVTVAGSIYVITHAASGVHVIQQIDQSRLPPEAPPVEPPAGGAQPRGPIAADEGSTIDLLVAYTPSARMAQGGTASIEALIALGVSDTNQAYANSGVSQRLRLVQRVEIAYTESGNMGTDLARLSAPSDGHLDAIHGLRDSSGADLVQLIENSGDFCGVAYLMANVGPGFESAGFGITHYQCISPSLTFAHELGHNMGVHHDTYVTSNNGAYAYSHGYVNQAAFAPGATADKRWRDIMAYNNQCDANGFFCSRLLYFSNPLNTYTGDPMGNAASADAVRTLNQTAPTVANFRQSVNNQPPFTDLALTSQASRHQGCTRHRVAGAHQPDSERPRSAGV